jgi:hypothetical protein
MSQKPKRANLWTRRFTHPNDHSDAALVFLNRLHKAVPEVFSTLRDDMLPKCTLRIAQGIEVERAIGRTVDDCVEWAFQFHLIESRDVFEWSFTYGWLRRAIWPILRHWCERPCNARNLDLPQMKLRYEDQEKLITSAIFS